MECLTKSWLPKAYRLGTVALAGALALPIVASAEDTPTAAVEAKQPEMPDALKAAMEWLAGFQIAGIVDASYNYNFNGPAGNVNAIHVFDPESNKFSLDLAQLKVSKAITEDLGATVTLSYGETAKILGAGTSGLGGADDFELEEAYVHYHFLPSFNGGLMVTAGKFVTLYGAEVIEAPKNPNISRSILFGWAIPFTHTGAYASVPLVEGKVNLDVGIANGWDNVNDANDGKTFLGQIDLTPWDGTTINIGGTYGAEQAGQGDKRALLDVIVAQTIGEKVSLLLNFDYGTEEDVDFAGEDDTVVEDDATWLGFAAIASFAATDDFTASIRGEVFDDSDGARTGTEQTMWEVTLTGAYKITDNLVARGEYRHDASDEDFFVDGDGSGTDSQDQVMAELYVTF